MRIICEYCKSRIDTDKDNNCPNCHASYSDNKMFQERIEILKEEKKIDLENKKIQNEMTKKVLESSQKIKNVQKIIFIFPILIFIIILISIFTIVFNQIKNRNYNEQPRSIFSSNNTTTKVIEKKVTVNLNEYGETSEYKVMVDKISKLDKLYGVIAPPEGKKYIVFHLIVENKLNKTLKLNKKINCIVDGFSQNETYYYSKYPALPFSVDANLKVEGNIIFEVPKNADTYIIRYGDYVTIHIESK